VGREGHDCEIERYGPHVAFRFRIADSALRWLRHTSEYLAARSCEAVGPGLPDDSPVRVEFIHNKPEDRVDYPEFFGCAVKFDAAWDAVINAEETTPLPVKRADTKLLEVLVATCQRRLGPLPRSEISFARSVI
jgi:hypothetical protein